MAGERARWLANVTAYTVGGAASSVLAGALLGVIGGFLLPAWAWAVGVPIVIALAALAAARELGWISFPLPQPRRQTGGVWARTFGARTAATFWGLDLGLIFTTWFTFSGTWLLVLVAILSRDALFAGALFLAFWLGRAMPAWIGPLLVRNARGIPHLLDEVESQYRVFQLTHVLALVFMTAFLVFSIV